MNKEELLCYLKEDPKNFKKLYNRKYISKINWDYVPEELIEEYTNTLKSLNWYLISTSSGLSEIFIAKHNDLVDWNYISVYQKLSESFIIEHKDLVNRECISKYQKLSESFIAEHKDFVCWPWISAYQKLSEEFIEKHKDLVNWRNISTCQKLSESFIIEHNGLVKWKLISKYQKLSENFISEYKALLDMCLVNDNWLNKSTEFKKRAVINTGKYKCYEDYFIAYKGIKRDRYSKYNFQYQYMPGEMYECFSDGSNNDYSFGLSVWTKEKATEYCNELVVRCKVYYEDVTRVVHDDYKIRCSKITILN